LLAGRRDSCCCSSDEHGDGSNAQLHRANSINEVSEAKERDKTLSRDEIRHRLARACMRKPKETYRTSTETTAVHGIQAGFLTSSFCGLVLPALCFDLVRFDVWKCYRLRVRRSDRLLKQTYSCSTKEESILHGH
jgi:hypothetical protein